ncbi:MAG: tetraacyldisaccharide 4'-kinase [Deltaproteobacteria bacterium]|nr:tetraacyldisaccharide 4'-kinase [Deltaproteobacteria bacterium]
MMLERAWSNQKPAWHLAIVRAILYSLSWPYRLGTRIDRFLYDSGFRKIRKLPVRVACVGNISVGGSGKTPFCAFLARGLSARGERVVLISRGYRRQNRDKVLIVCHGSDAGGDVCRAGDEPALLARRSGSPVVVGADRVAAGELALQKFDPDWLVLDDGFQHRRLGRDVDIVLLDAGRCIEEEHLLPRGPLRESISGLKRAHMIVLTHWREDRVCRRNWDFLKSTMNKPMFRAVHKPAALLNGNEIMDPSVLSGKRVLAFCGLANNESFLETIEHLGARPVCFLGFRDHPRYSSRDVRRITSLAATHGAEAIVTTEKDLMNLQHLVRPDFRPLVLCIEMRLIEDEDAFWLSWNQIAEDVVWK